MFRIAYRFRLTQCEGSCVRISLIKFYTIAASLNCRPLPWNWVHARCLVVELIEPINNSNRQKRIFFRLNISNDNCISSLKKQTLTVSLWNASIKRDFNLRYSSVCPHFGPLNTKHGLTQVPILSFLKSCRPLYCLMPNSTISNNSCSNMRPSIKLSGRFFDVDPNINSVQSFFSDKL